MVHQASTIITNRDKACRPWSEALVIVMVVVYIGRSYASNGVMVIVIKATDDVDNADDYLLDDDDDDDIKMILIVLF